MTTGVCVYVCETIMLALLFLFLCPADVYYTANCNAGGEATARRKSNAEFCFLKCRRCWGNLQPNLIMIGSNHVDILCGTVIGQPRHTCNRKERSKTKTLQCKVQYFGKIAVIIWSTGLTQRRLFAIHQRNNPATNLLQQNHLQLSPHLALLTISRLEQQCSRAIW